MAVEYAKEEDPALLSVLNENALSIVKKELIKVPLYRPYQSLL